MNRVQGDYFETLLYKIFVSIDEHTNIGELASVLQVDLQLVKVGVVCGPGEEGGGEGITKQLTFFKLLERSFL